MFDFVKKMFSSPPAVDFKELVKNGAVIVDVRTSEEYNSGHIPGSFNFPLDQLAAVKSTLKKQNKPVITCCRSGNRSGIAKGLLEASGIECYNGGPWNVLEKAIWRA